MNVDSCQSQLIKLICKFQETALLEDFSLTGSGFFILKEICEHNPLKKPTAIFT